MALKKISQLIKMKPRNFISHICLSMLLLFSIQAYGFQFTDINGKNHALSDYKGRWVLVNFWATWCPPCLKEIPDLVSLYESRKDLIVIGVAIDEADPDLVLEFVESMSISYPTIIGDRRVAAQIDEISFLPSTYLYDPTGNPAARKQGLITRAEIEEFLESKSKEVHP
jgi:thiol-disulfide isomerase/thioredoxin